MLSLMCSLLNLDSYCNAHLWSLKLSHSIIFGCYLYPLESAFLWVFKFLICPGTLLYCEFCQVPSKMNSRTLHANLMSFWRIMTSSNRFITLASEWNRFWFHPSVRLLPSRELVGLVAQGQANAFGCIQKKPSDKRCKTTHTQRFFVQT
jgi:hypothetical protein